MVLSGVRYFILDKSEICLPCQICRCVSAWHCFPRHIYVQQVPYDHVISLIQPSGKELTMTPNYYASKCLNPIHSIEHSTFVVGDVSAAFIFSVHCYDTFRLSLNLSPLQKSNRKSMDMYLSPLHFLSSAA